MSHLSLRQRAQVVQERFQLPKFHATTVQDYYRRNNIKHKNPDYKFWKSSADIDDLHGRQLLFVQELGELLVSKAYDEILYLDETTCNLWQKVSKCWLKPGMKLLLLKTRGHSITIIGAISAERGLVHAEVFPESNDGEKFRNYMLALRSKCEGRRVLVVLDNLRIHHAKILSDVFTSNFQSKFLPPYSSELNPIERLWSLVKRRWTKGLFAVTEELTRYKALRSIHLRAVQRLKGILGKWQY